MHVVYDYEKEYRVLVARRSDEEQLATWRSGLVLQDGYRTQPAEVRVESTQGKGVWLWVVLCEGRKRQIRETGWLLGLSVVKIIRVRIGSLRLGTLKPGEWRYLTADEVAALRGQAGKIRSSAEKIGAKPRKSGKPNQPRGKHEIGRER